jgi:H+/Cl- antiporter ClcA
MPANQFTDRIRDYMPWSIINICIGGVFLGLIAVLFSYITIRRKQKNNVQAAQRWSKITLIYNVLVDLAVIALIIIIIIVYTTRKRNTYTYPY